MVVSKFTGAQTQKLKVRFRYTINIGSIDLILANSFSEMIVIKMLIDGFVDNEVAIAKDAFLRYLFCESGYAFALNTEPK